jgi:hypothetical protein
MVLASGLWIHRTLATLQNEKQKTRNKKANARSLKTRQKTKKQITLIFHRPNPAAVTPNNSQLKNARRRSQVTIRVGDASN